MELEDSVLEAESYSLRLREELMAVEPKHDTKPTHSLTKS
jgi:hypothetical protein